MQNLSHPFLNRHGSLDHALADRAARDARSEAIRTFLHDVGTLLNALVSSLEARGNPAVHVN